MSKKKVSKSLANLTVDNNQKTGFLKRFSMFFQAVLILGLTGGAIYGTQFFDVSSFVVQLSIRQTHWPLTDILVVSGISLIGLLILFIRYSGHLRKKVNVQVNGSEDAKRLAFFDSLTNLPNKALCHDRLEQAIARAANNKTSIAVLFIGIDDFKSVNKQKGNDVGDVLLQEVAKRLAKELTQSDTLARITGVEFVIILESLSTKDNITAIADNILKKLVKFYRISTQEVYLTGNVGIAMYPNDGENSKELINNSDTAMCFAQGEGVNSLAFFSKDIQEQVNKKKIIAKCLRSALDKEEFSLNYQPIVATKTQKIIGVEALLRWNNKHLGEMAPDVFIPIAEEIGLITKIGDWVLSQACEQNKIWHDQGHNQLVMTVNLSSIQFSLKSYSTTVGASLAASELDPKYLELDFTEDVLMKDVKQSMVQLKKLNDLGVSIALDDFGSGYSSLQYLPKFALNKLKIDGHFLKHLPKNAVDATIIRGITAMAQEFKLKITAEGVETETQCQFIEHCQIDSMQGFYFSKPVSSEAFSKLLSAPPWLPETPDGTLDITDDEMKRLAANS